MCAYVDVERDMQKGKGKEEEKKSILVREKLTDEGRCGNCQPWRNNLIFLRANFFPQLCSEKNTCRYLYFKRKALVEFRTIPRPRAERGPWRDRERNAVEVVGIVAASALLSSGRLLALASSRKGSIKQATTVEFPARKLPSCSHRAVLAKKHQRRGENIYPSIVRSLNINNASIA